MVAPGKSVFFTETGYNTATSAAPPYTGTTEASQAKYLTRAVANAFNLGVSKTFVYELLNAYPNPTRDWAEANWGIVREDFSYKPAATAFKNLIQLLEDPGPAFTPGRLDFTLSGHDATTQTLLLQKQNGDYYLAIWQEATSYDLSTQRDIPIPPQTITLTLSTPILSAQTYLPIASANPQQTFTGTPGDPLTRLTLSVPDALLLVRLRPDWLPGDATFDHVVDHHDFQTLLTHFNQPGQLAQGDFNHD